MRVLFVLCAACGSSGGSSSVDASAIDATHGGSGRPDGGGMPTLISTLTSSCATLQGRAIVNYNDNLGIAFTESDSPYTFVGSVQFQLPDGFTGAVPNPEVYAPNTDRHIAAMTTPDFDLHGNHCWMSVVPPTGTLVIDEYRPTAGIVKATFSSYPLHSCTGATVCTVSGKIETTGSGVFTGDGFKFSEFDAVNALKSLSP